MIIAARNDGGVLRKYIDSRNLVIDRNITADPVPELLVERRVEIGRILVNPVQHLIQGLIGIQGVADGHPAVDEIVDVFPGPFQ
ncbi:hypothetical protein D1872_274490 [compost metagenome]